MSDTLNLVDSLMNNPKFSIFTKGVHDAGLVDLLNEPGPFTILTPTDEAFAKVPEGTMTDLGKPENKSSFAEVLKFHIIKGKIMSDEIAKLTTVKTIQGQEIKIDATNGIKINGAKLQARNLEATNGVIHAIDAVLAPAATAKMV